jgi:hypothetical protein
LELALLRDEGREEAQMRTAPGNDGVRRKVKDLGLGRSRATDEKQVFV